MTASTLAGSILSSPTKNKCLYSRMLVAAVSGISGNNLGLCFIFFVIVFFSEISPYYFCNKDNIGNVIGRDIKVSHIKLI